MILRESGIAKLSEQIAEDIISILNAQKEPIILSMDQSKISDGFEMLMVSLKYNKRALPLL